MTPLFSTADYLWMAAYLVGLLILTLSLKRLASGGMSDYFLGGKRIPWWAMGISGMASHLDMTGTMLLVSILVLLGPQGMFVEIRGGLALIMAFAMVFQGKWNRRSGCMTVAEWMEYRFGNGLSGRIARLIQAAATLIATVGMIAYFVKGSGLFLSLFLPFSPEVCALGLVVIATLYTTLTGFYGVIFTDLFQAIFIVGASVLIAVMAVGLVQDAPALQSMAASVSGNPTWGSIAVPLRMDMPEAYKGFEMFAIAIGYYLLYTVFIGISNSGGTPMYFGARNERECGTLSFVWILTSVIRWPLIAGLVVLGITLTTQLFPDTTTVRDAAAIVKKYEPEVQAQNWNQTLTRITQTSDTLHPEMKAELQALLGERWQERLLLVGYHGSINMEQVLPAVIRFSIPNGLRGLIFIALLAAAMSTFDSQLNMSAAYFVRDIYQRWLRPGATDAHLIKVSHITCVVIVTISFVVGYHASSINDIWGWITLGLGGGLALPSLLRWLWWRFNGWGYAGGTAAGMVAAIFQRICFPDMPVWFAFPAILLCSGIAAVLATFLTQATPHDVLANFYRTTRPFGMWSRFRKELSPERQRSINNENRNDIIATCFAVPWQFSLYWTAVMFLFQNQRGLWLGVSTLLITSAGLYFFWYRALPGADVKGSKITRQP
ncbi:MAG: sodium:solute symporter family transporter [Chthoniobacterales bacterium]